MKLIIAWLLFWVGHAISKLASWFGWDWLYRSYNWCMNMSSAFDTNSRIWKGCD